MTRKNQPIEEDSSYGISNGKSIFFIGAGNVATHLSHALLHAGYKIKGVYSRTTSSAQTLGDDLGCFWTTNIEELLGYIYSKYPHVIVGFNRETQAAYAVVKNNNN